MTDAEKREKQIVLRKLAEMEEELKVNSTLLYTINLIPYKALNQLRRRVLVYFTLLNTAQKLNSPFSLAAGFV